MPVRHRAESVSAMSLLLRTVSALDARYAVPMLSSSSRLLRVLSLLQTRSHWSGQELAERLAVNPRTLRRDIDRLRQLGYPIHATSGVAGGYAFRAGQALPPLLLDDDEALAVAIALQVAAAGTVSGVEEASLRALVKLAQVMPARLRRRTDALRSAILPLQRMGPTVDANVLVFERIKEEMRKGAHLQDAIDTGFSRAWSSIRDSNIATLVICFILWTFGRNFGASSVEGFAVTLAIGVFISMFTAVFATRTLVRLFLGRNAARIHNQKWLLGI